MSRYADGIRHSSSGAETVITGDVVFSAAPTFVDLTVEATINGVDIGTCASPNILLTGGSCAGAEQTVTGSLAFNTDSAPQQLVINKVSLAPGATVQGANSPPCPVASCAWSDLMAEMIDRNSQSEVVITAKKTFDQPEFNVDMDVDLTFESTVFGLDLHTPYQRVTDMRYPTGDHEDIPDSEDGDKRPVMPDLATSLANIAENSGLLRDQYSHMAPLYTTLNTDLESKTIAIFSELNVDTEEEFDALPFHLVTFIANITSRKVDMMFHRMISLSGEIKVEVVEDANPFGELPDLFMSTDWIGKFVVFGDMIALRNGDSGEMFYVFLAATTSDSFARTLWIANGVDGSVTNSEETWTSLEPFKSSSPCFIACGPASSLVCIDTDLTLHVEEIGSTEHCFQTSSITLNSTEETSLVATTASHKNVRTGSIDVYKFFPNPDTTAVLPAHTTKQSITCNLCSYASLGSYGAEVFIAVLSETLNFITVGKWNEDEQFEVFQSFTISQPTEATFYNQDGDLYLSVVAASEIRMFMYRGAMAFTEEKERVIRLTGITSHNIIAHPLMPSPLISSTGYILKWTNLITDI